MIGFGFLFVWFFNLFICFGFVCVGCLGFFFLFFGLCFALFCFFCKLSFVFTGSNSRLVLCIGKHLFVQGFFSGMYVCHYAMVNYSLLSIFNYTFKRKLLQWVIQA